MSKFQIQKKNVQPLLDTKYIKVFDLQYKEGAHYYDATRRDAEDMVATKSEEEFNAMLPDAVSCFVEIRVKEEAPKLLMFYEYRYPTGQYMLSIPAGLLDPSDKEEDEPVFSAAIREIHEETGVVLQKTDSITMVNPLSFTTPGLTDESNALIHAVVYLDDLSELSQKGAVGSEQFDGFYLADREQVKEILKTGKDPHGHAYPLMTWAAMMYFLMHTESF